jgi:hypothetical protein
MLSIYIHVGLGGTFGNAARAKKRDYTAARVLSFIITAGTNKLLVSLFSIFVDKIFFAWLKVSKLLVF